MWRFLTVMCGALMLAGCCTRGSKLEYKVEEANWQDAFCSVEPDSTYEMLSTHDVNAIYTGIETIPCRFRTALCPNRCGHGGEMANFEVTRYRMLRTSTQISDTQRKTIMVSVGEMAPELKELIKRLPAGTPVRVVYQGIYVRTKEGSRYPAWAIVRLEQLDTDQAAK